MAKCCFSFAATRDHCFRFSFSMSGLKSVTIDLGDGTVMHCWVPKRFKKTKPNLVLIHGVGANAMWQFNDFISPLIAHFNVFVPDLIFFGDSFTTRSDRSETFQARCVAELLTSLGVKKTNLVGMSYGGFVAYSIAAQYPDLVEKLVLCGAGVAMEEKDMDEGMFRVKSVDEATALLFPKTPEKARDLIGMTFHKPVKRVPTCFLQDFIDVMCTEYIEEKKELIHALHKDRKLSDLPKISKAPFMIWGEYDRVFPIELGHRLKRHLNDNATLVVIKDAGHAINAEKSTEMFKHLKAFLLEPILPSVVGSESNGRKID